MRRRKNKNLVLVLLLVIVGGIVGYAALRTTLTINGETTVAKNTWSVKFTTITPVKNDGTITTEPVVTGNTTFRFGVKLNKPGDEYKVKVKVENQGTIDAMLSVNPTLSGLEDMSSYLEYSVKYVDGAPVEKGNLLAAGSEDEILVTLKFKKDISETDLAGLAAADVTKTMTFSMTYVQADNTAAVRNKMVCKAAETLHTETCNSQSGYGCLAKGYAQGATITYGHTDSSKLTNGQLTNGQSGGYALDCDVSGNGDYERFYYVSDLYTGTINGTDQFDSNYAVLIYHKNIGTSGARYYYENGAGENWHGPVTLLSSLPTRSTWPNENIGLKNTSRTIVNEQGAATTNNGSNTIENPFNYTGAVGRLLTVQEINKSCNITVGSYTTGELDSCEYLMEDTFYSKTSGCSGGNCLYWLETPGASSSDFAWYVHGNSRNVIRCNAYNPNGVRPAVEIKKADISLD